MRKIRPLLITLFFAFCTYAARDPAKLRVLGENYPRTFFFRGCEGLSSKKNAEWGGWESGYSRLMGIMGKCLDEEVLGREVNNPEWFSKFKEKNPEQVVLLHFNGNARDPRYRTERYFAGHWIYRKAIEILSDIPAEEGESEIQLRDVSGFQTNKGRYLFSNDDIALFGITASGIHDWNYCEQVQLISIDTEKNRIRVKRGCYGTKPLEFKASKSRAAAHVVEGPWGKKNNIMWFYNFSAQSPLDAVGKSCADRVVDDLAIWFGRGGKLEAFDGLEFDVMHNVTHGDTTGDGEEDNGVVDGINVYGNGVYAFAQQLRKRLGPEIIIQADGALGPGGERSQRANGILNGIESEGWPNLRDWDFNDWSGGINRHNFWQLNAFSPAFSYMNHKWIERVPGKPGVQRYPKVPFARHRLVFAAAQFTDAVLTCAFPPPGERGQPVAIWDELNCGTDSRLGWLGKPMTETICLAKDSPDLFKGAGSSAGEALAKRIVGDVTVEITSAGLLISSEKPDSRSLTFSIQDLAVSVDSSELTVFAEISANPRKGYPKEMPRFAQLFVSGGCIDLMHGGDRLVTRGICLRGSQEQELDRATGANLRYQSAVTIGDKTIAAFALHPPYKKEKGYVWWSREVTLPAKEYNLRFYLGMSERAPFRSDGLWYKIYIAEIKDDKVGEFKKIFGRATKAHEWIPGEVSLKEWAGKKVLIKFVADCGPKNNTTTDQGFWGGVKLVQSGISDSEITLVKGYMSWVNHRPFTASFYFRNIRSEYIDLNFTIEGGEPLLLKSLSAHAAADARCRRFENGVVLGNPSLEPYTFELSVIACDRSLRRIKATSKQDGEANNGKPVGDKVTLGPLDGLFLLEK